MDEAQLIHTIPKNSMEEIRCSLCSYKGHPYLDLRSWFREHDRGEWKPTKKGFTLPTHLSDELILAVGKLQAAVDEQPKQRRLKTVAN